jgi:hypothetical protein
MDAEYNGVKFTDKDVVEPSDFIPKGDYNPHKVHPFLLHDHGFAVCVVFADSLQEALDKAVDEGKLDFLQIDPEDDGDRSDYMTADPKEMAGGLDPECPEYVAPDGTKYWWKDDCPAFLGNASEPFDIESLGVEELPNPPYSWCAMFAAAHPAK